MIMKKDESSIFTKAKIANEKEKNPEKAEKLYLEAIQKNDRPGSAAADLVRLMMHNHKLEKAAEYLERYGSKYMREKAYENVRKQLIEQNPKLEDAFFSQAEKAKTEEDYFGLAQKARKEEPLKAVDYYKLAIANGQRTTSSVPNLVQLYIKLEKFDEALFLLEDEGKGHIDDTKYLNLKLAVFSSAKNKKYKEEMQETYRQIAALSTSEEKHTALLFDQAYWMNQIGAYEDAVELYKQCQEKIRQGIYPIFDKSNYGRQDLRALSGLCKAYLELKEYDKAKEYAKEILAIQQNNKFAKSVLGGQVDEAKYYDQISDYKISAYILQKTNDFRLKNELWRKDKEYVKYIKEDEFTGPAEKAQYIISGIQKQIDKCMNDKCVNDEVQSNNYFVIAKLIRQMIDRDGENRNFNEVHYQLEIAYGSFFYGNYRLCTTRSTHHNPDTARYCFFMPILIFQDVERLHRDWAIATIMYIESCFSSEEIKHDAKLYYDFRDDKENYENKIKSVMQRKISSSYEEFVIAMLEMLEYNSKAKRVVLSNLYKKAKGEKRILDALGHVADTEIPDSINFKQFEDFWNAATKKYRAKRKMFIDIIDETIKSAFSIIHQNEFEESEFHAYLTKTDKEHMEDLKEILNALRKYNEEAEFAYKAENLKKADKIMKRLKEEIAENPTYIGYEKLMPILNRFQAKIVEEAAKFYGDNKPDISVELRGDCSIDTQQRIVRAPIAYRNKKNVQNADNVSVKIFGEGVEVMGDGQLSKGLLSGNGIAQEMLVHFKVTPEIIKNQAFTVEVFIGYQYKKSMNETEDAHMELQLPIKLYSDATFEPIENKFENHSDGLPVKDETMFYGREEDIQNIIRQISDKSGSVLKGRCLALYGQTRTGKSSLLYFLEKRLRAINEEGNVIVNAESIGEQDLSKDMTEFLYTLLDKLEYEIRRRHPILKKILADAGIEIDVQKFLDAPEHSQLYFSNVFKKINRCMEDGGHKYNIIVMLDEFTYIYDWIRRGIMTDRFMRFWKAFIQNNGIFAIIIGQDHMMDFVKQFENDFGAIGFHKVTYISEKYAKQLMYEPIMLVTKDGKKENRYLEGALERLYELTAGSAFLIMKLCAGLVSYLNETRTVYITRAHIDEYLKKNLSAFEEKTFEPQYNDKSNIDNEEAGKENNKRILKRIAQLSNKKEWAMLSDVIKDKEDEEIVDSLEERDVIIVSERKRCKIKVALYKEWMIEKYGTEDDNG